MKKHMYLGLALLMALSLVGCDNEQKAPVPSPSENVSVTPIYQGVEFTSETTKMVNQSILALDDDDINDSIKNDFGVLTSEEIEYYAKKDEKAYISLKLYNPSQFEILSFVLNGVKYQSFQFREDSTSSQINVALTMPSDSGVASFKIEGVKYIDGDDIKDCRMDGKQEIKVGILYDNLPSALINLNVNYQYVDFSINLMDPSNMIEETKGQARLYLFDETGIINKSALKLGLNEIRFEGLEEGKEYTYALATTLDYYDGKGMRSHVIETKSFRTNDYIKIDGENVDKRSISLNIVKGFDELKIDKVDLILNGSVVNTLADTSVLFDNLLSNTDYEVRIYYSYNQKEYVTKRLYKTLALDKPEADIVLESTKRDISYNVKFSDSDNIFKLDSVELLKNGVVLNTMTELGGVFDNLLSNTEYTVRLSYSYDLNDGSGKEVATKEATIKTKELMAPSFGFKHEMTPNLLTGSVIVNDLDNVSNVIGVYLYMDANDSLVEYSEGSKDFSFNIASNVDYRLVVKYEYDLNDGNGVNVSEYSMKLSSAKIVPTIEITGYNITQDRIDYDLFINDSNASGKLKSVRIYEGLTFIKKMNEFDSYVDNLKHNTDYMIEVVYVYDMDDGLGSREIRYEYKFKTLKLNPSFELKSEATKNSITFDYEINDPDKALEFNKVSLFNDRTNELVAEITDINTLAFNELLSNTAYRIECSFKSNLNNGEYDLNQTYFINTLALDRPSVEISLDSDKTNISYLYKLTDNDGVVKTQNVYLYKNGEKLEITAVDKMFSNLLSNNDYKVVVELGCDFKDGKGNTIVEFHSSIKTKALEAPSASVEFISTETTITPTFTFVDNDKVLNIDKLELYLAGELIKTYDSIDSLVLSDLLSNSIYTIKLYYHYDLNDGVGVVNKTLESEYSTLAYPVVIKDFKVLNEVTPKTNENISIELTIENKSNVEIKTLTINGTEYEIYGGNGKDNLIVVIDSGDMGGTITYTVSNMSYVLNGFTVSQEVNTTKPVEIKVLSRLNILGINTIDDRRIAKAGTTMGLVVKVDNPDGYKLLKINEMDVITIDNYHVYIPSVGQTNSLYINSLEYVDNNGNSAIRRYNDSFRCDVVFLEPDELTNSLVTELIETPEDLLNIKDGKMYELACDIDMSNHTWVRRDFNGYIDGKGHSIKNLKYIYEDEYQEMRSASLFTSFNGTLKNIYFESFYISYQTNANVNCNPLYENGDPILENVLFSGSFVTKGAAEFYMPAGNGVYIVDSIKINGKNQEYNNVITTETYNTKEFKENTLGWKFTPRVYKEQGGYRYYIVDNSYVMINKYIGTEEIVKIPLTIENLPVLGLDDLAFEDNKSINSLYLNEDLLYVGGSILKGCSNLTGIYNFCPSVKYLGNLFGKVQYENSYENSTDNAGVTGYIPNGLKEIEYVTDATSGLMIMGNASSVERVAVAGDIENVGASTFWGCSNLKTVELPNTIKRIENLAFADCKSLEAIELPEGLTFIGMQAFYKSGLRSITLPNSLTKLDNNSFWNAHNLEKVVFPNNLTEIAGDCFNGTSLVTVVLPDTIKKIGSQAFVCNTIKNLYLPRGLKEVDYNFCGYGTTIYYEGSEAEWEKVEKNSFVVESQKFIFNRKITSIENLEDSTLKYTVFNGKDVTIDCLISKDIKTLDLSNYFADKNLVAIGKEAFMGSSLTNVILPNTIKAIDNFAFAQSGNLKSINLPEGLEKIGVCAFENTGINDLVIPSTVKVIEEKAFSSCLNLNKLTISNGVQEIGNSAFSVCDGLTTIEIPASVKKIGDRAFSSCHSLSKVILNEGLEEIGSECFSDDRALLECNLPSTLRTLNSNAFVYCYDFKSVVIPKSITALAPQVFNQCYFRFAYIHKGVTEIGSEALNGTGMVMLYEGTEEEFKRISISQGNATDIIRYEVKEAKFNGDFKSFTIYYLDGRTEVIN